MNVDSELWRDVNVVASLLKLFFRKLPESLITPGNWSGFMFPLLNAVVAFALALKTGDFNRIKFHLPASSFTVQLLVFLPSEIYYVPHALLSTVYVLVSVIDHTERAEVLRLLDCCSFH